MRAEIERLIAGIDKKSDQAIEMHDFYRDKNETVQEMFNFGLYVAYGKVIRELKAVLTNGENDISREDWEQSPEYKRFSQRTKEVKHETGDTRNPPDHE